MVTTARCESCTAITRIDDLVEVRRVYYFDAEDPTPDVQDDVERWCSGCRETYPNEEAVGGVGNR